ncbi:hypothetical protein DPMN_143537 [Dreissena polymorpha]|uniref:PLAT domain-containing protein n=1 Tax=Dreissena polymorpha TaxID=45954 RepID=A0A9D4GDW3_DREPO|nr:hypothetical protein DPMN_143537 [Dreissena polymorpha]
MQFEITVKTGDRLGAGTDANVFVILYGNGGSSDETKLDDLFRNDFERGQTDVFYIEDQQFETVTSLELWKGSAGLFADWYIDTITVKNVSTAWQTVFPIFRWIKSDLRYKFVPCDTSLPQDEQNKEQRERELSEKRQLYQYCQRSDGFPCQVKVLPDDEKFSFAWIWDVNIKKTKLKVTSKFKDLFTKSWKTIEDLKTVFTEGDSLFPEPLDCSRWDDDVKFGMQRFAGTNNTVIRLCTEIPEKLAVTPDMLKPFLGTDTLESD